MFVVYSLNINGTPVYFGEGAEAYGNGDYGRVDTHLRGVNAALKKRLTLGDYRELYNYIADRIAEGAVFTHSIVERTETKGAAVDVESKLVREHNPLFNRMADGVFLKRRVTEHDCRAFGVRGPYATPTSAGIPVTRCPAVDVGSSTGLAPEAYRSRRRERASVLFARRKAVAEMNADAISRCDAALVEIDRRYGVEPVVFRTKTTRNRPRARMTEAEERAFLEPFLQRNARVTEILIELRRRFVTFSLGGAYAMMRRCGYTPPKRRAAYKLSKEDKAEMRKQLGPLWGRRRRAELTGDATLLAAVEAEIKAVEEKFIGKLTLSDVPPGNVQTDYYLKSRKRGLRESLLAAVARDDIPAIRLCAEELARFLEDFKAQPHTLSVPDHG